MSDRLQGLEQLNQGELARFAVNALRLTILHYGFWFNEVQHQLGMEESIRAEHEVSATVFPIAAKRLSKAIGIETSDQLPLSLASMPREKLMGLIDALALNWLANDGVWFQAVEKRHDLNTAKRCNDTCWTRFSPLEASMIMSFLNIPEQAGLQGLAKALNFRLYARINKQTTKKQGDDLIFRMVTCRVQDARKSKGLEDYPCKSAGLVEYQTFAKTIDDRIRTECLACPPDSHPPEWACAWRFYME
jgi:hypothetical protein